MGHEFINNGMSDLWFDNDKVKAEDYQGPVCRN